MGLLGPRLDLNLASRFSFFTATIADIKYETIKASKIRQNHFSAIWTFNLHKELFISLFKQEIGEIYALSASMDPTSIEKQSDLKPTEKSKISIKYKYNF